MCSKPEATCSGLTKLSLRDSKEAKEDMEEDCSPNLHSSGGQSYHLHQSQTIARTSFHSPLARSSAVTREQSVLLPELWGQPPRLRQMLHPVLSTRLQFLRHVSTHAPISKQVSCLRYSCMVAEAALPLHYSLFLICLPNCAFFRGFAFPRSGLIQIPLQGSGCLVILSTWRFESVPSFTRFYVSVPRTY